MSIGPHQCRKTTFGPLWPNFEIESSTLPPLRIEAELVPGSHKAWAFSPNNNLTNDVDDTLTDALCEAMTDGQSESWTMLSTLFVRDLNNVLRQ